MVTWRVSDCNYIPNKHSSFWWTRSRWFLIAPQWDSFTRLNMTPTDFCTLCTQVSRHLAKFSIIVQMLPCIFSFLGPISFSFVANTFRLHCFFIFSIFLIITLVIWTHSSGNCISHFLDAFQSIDLSDLCIHVASFIIFAISVRFAYVHMFSG